MSLRSGIVSIFARASRLARRSYCGADDVKEEEEAVSESSHDVPDDHDGSDHNHDEGDGIDAAESNESSDVSVANGGHVAPDIDEGPASAYARDSEEEWSCNDASESASKFPLNGCVDQAGQEEEWSCNVASEPTSSKIPSPGCAFVSRQQEELWSCSGVSEPIAFVLPVFVAVGNNKKKPWAHAPINKKRWILDGATSYLVTNDLCDLFDVRKLSEYDVAFTVGNSTKMRPTHDHADKAQFGIVTLTEVYMCKECSYKQISEGGLILKGMDINKFAITGLCQCFCQLQDQIIFTASMIDGMFFLIGIIVKETEWLSSTVMLL
jgi:hypothetical protein